MERGDATGRGWTWNFEVRSREVCERRVGLDVSCKLSAPWLAILGGRVSSRFYPGKNFSLFLSLSPPLTSSLTRSPFVRFSNFFHRRFYPIFPRWIEEKKNRKKFNGWCILLLIVFCLFFFFFFCFLSFRRRTERNSIFRVRVLFVIIFVGLFLHVLSF